MRFDIIPIMARSGNSRTVHNLLRFSGLLFAFVGTFHVLRFFFRWEFKIGGFEVTALGSLIVGVLLVLLSLACFLNARK